MGGFIYIRVMLTPSDIQMEINKLDFYPLRYHDGAEDLQTKIRARSQAFLKRTMFCEIGAGQTFTYEGAAFLARRKIVAATKEDEDVSRVHKHPPFPPSF